MHYHSWMFLRVTLRIWYMDFTTMVLIQCLIPSLYYGTVLLQYFFCACHVSAGTVAHKTDHTLGLTPAITPDSQELIWESFCSRALDVTASAEMKINEFRFQEDVFFYLWSDCFWQLRVTAAPGKIIFGKPHSGMPLFLLCMCECECECVCRICMHALLYISIYFSACSILLIACLSGNISSS